MKNSISGSKGTGRVRGLRFIAIALLAAALGSFGAGCGGGPLVRQAAELNARGAEQLSRGRVADAEASFRLALEYNERYAEPHNNLGLAALSRGAIREARAHFRDAVSRNPDFAEAWSNLGVALTRSAGPGDEDGTPEAIRNAFRESLEANPGFVDARVNLCRWLLERREFSEALEQARRLVQAAPEHALARALRVEAALALGAHEEALAECAEGARIDARDADVRLSCARVSMARGDVRVAAEALDGLLDEPRVRDAARALRAAVYLATGDREGARRTVSGLTGRAAEQPVARLVRERLQAGGAVR